VAAAGRRSAKLRRSRRVFGRSCSPSALDAEHTNRRSSLSESLVRC
jgi:hypothetical protein